MSVAADGSERVKAKQTESEPNSVADEGKPRRRAVQEVSSDTLEATRTGIEDCLRVVKDKLTRFNRWNGILTGATILFSALATAAAGGMGLGGDRAAASLPGSWRLACFVAATFSLIVTVASAFAGKYQVAETVARCTACHLDFANLKLDFTEKKPALLVAHFKKLRKAYNDILGGGF